MLALALLGFVPTPAPQADAALAMAKAAGALCLADGPEGLPSDQPHEHCLACRAAPAGGTLAEAPALPLPRITPVRMAATEVRPAPAGGRAAYAPRAPPAHAG